MERRDEEEKKKNKKKKDGNETERQTKFKLKFKVIYLHSPLSRVRLRGTLKGTDGEKEKKKKKDRSGKKIESKKSNYIQLISNQSQNKMKQCVERTWLLTKPSNQPEKKKKKRTD